MGVMLFQEFDAMIGPKIPERSNCASQQGSERPRPENAGLEREVTIEDGMDGVQAGDLSVSESPWEFGSRASSTPAPSLTR